MNNFKNLTILILVFVLSFTNVEAQTLSELSAQLKTVSSALSGLSKESPSRQAQISLIGRELQRISAVLSTYRSGTNGRVLGATYSLSSRRPLADVEIIPGSRNSDRVIAGGSYRDVLTFKIEPSYSDIWMQSIEISFDKKPWQYLKEISLVSGNKILAKITDLTSDDFAELDDDIYAIRFSGFSYKIEEGRNKTLKIRVRAEDYKTSSGIRVFLRDGSVRFFDQGNYHQQIPERSGGDRGRFSNEFEIIR